MSDDTGRAGWWVVHLQTDQHAPDECGAGPPGNTPMTVNAASEADARQRALEKPGCECRVIGIAYKGESLFEDDNE